MVDGVFSPEEKTGSLTKPLMMPTCCCGHLWETMDVRDIGHTFAVTERGGSSGRYVCVSSIIMKRENFLQDKTTIDGESR